jgi:hypothetical protein
MPRKKFKVGSKVKLSDRAPRHLELQRGRPRTIVSIISCPEQRCVFYVVGSNGRGATRDGASRDGYSAYPLRSYMLEAWNFTGKRGRPRKKRKYERQNGNGY